MNFSNSAPKSDTGNKRNVTSIRAKVMGLVLSTLVFCVGVIELITFYQNVRRRVVYPQYDGTLTHIRDGYIRELRNTRRQLIKDIERLSRVAAVDDLPSQEDKVVRGIPTFRLNSHEDIEIEYSEDLCRSRSPSPRRFLVTEKNEQEFDSRRRFVVSEEPQTIKKTKSQSSLPEFLIREEKNVDKSPDSPRYVLQEQNDSGERPIPLPRQFIVSESELNTIVFEDSLDCAGNNGIDYTRRSPSPFPHQVLPQPHKNSLCNDVLEYSHLDSVEEEQKSRSVSPTTVIEKYPKQAVVSNTTIEADKVPLVYTEVVGDGNHLKLTVSERTRSKSESDKSESHLAVVGVQKTSSISELTSCSKIQSNIELELEEALKEQGSSGRKHSSNEIGTNPYP